MLSFIKSSNDVSVYLQEQSSKFKIFFIKWKASKMLMYLINLKNIFFTRHFTFLLEIYPFYWTLIHSTGHLSIPLDIYLSTGQSENLLLDKNTFQPDI
jgi:hypothetical protein